MQVLWLRIMKSARKKFRSGKGAAVIEVSFLAPLLLFLAANILLFSIFMTDMANVKGNAMSLSCQGEEVTKEDWARVQDAMNLARVTSHQLDKGVTGNSLSITISARQLWRLSADYLPDSYEYKTKTYSLKDRRKELLWLQEK